jgi:ankyrin repeat protein
VSLALIVLTPAAPADETPCDAGSSEIAIRFEEDVAPILQAHCVECHGPTLQMADLRLDSRSAAMEAGVIEPGDSEQSLLVGRLSDKELGILMPPTGELPAEVIDILKSWIDRGAEWPEGVTLAAGRQASVTDLTMQSVKAAIRAGQIDALKRLVEDHSVVTLRDNRGASPLMIASLYGDVEAVKLLLDAGADANAAADDGATALMWGARNSQIVQLLIDSGASVSARSKLGRTPLAIAAAHAGNAQAASALLAAGADVNAQDNARVTPLTAAASTGDTELLQLLLDAGADVHLGDAKGYDGAPLTQAAYADDLAGVRLLLSRGAGTRDPGIKSEGEDEKSAHSQPLNLALIFACMHSTPELAEVLLDAGADPNGLITTGTYPETPLTAAVYSDYQSAEIVRLLLARGADVQRENTRGQSPIEIAHQHGDTPIVALLAEHRARQAAQQALTLLQSCGPTFFSKSGCTACHQQSATSLVLGLARPRGFVIDEGTAREQVKLTAVDLGTKESQFLQRRRIGGTTHRIAYLLLGLAAEDYPPDEITDAAVFELAGLQLKDGSWISDGHRPPSESSTISATAVTARAIAVFMPPALADEIEVRLARAREWLVEAKPVANEEYAFRLLGLKWTSADQGAIDAAREQLVKQQREDGGWGQLADLESDAYATGLSLFALHEGGGVDVRDAAYRRGVEFLLDTQQDDGSWHVKSRSFKFQPYFESGFPHGDDQWISAAATGWATMALLLTVDAAPEQVE